jgi:hypothetical protein
MQAVGRLSRREMIEDMRECRLLVGDEVQRKLWHGAMIPEVEWWLDNVLPATGPGKAWPRTGKPGRSSHILGSVSFGVRHWDCFSSERRNLLVLRQSVEKAGHLFWSTALYLH